MRFLNAILVSGSASGLLHRSGRRGVETPGRSTTNSTLSLLDVSTGEKNEGVRKVIDLLRQMHASVSNDSAVDHAEYDKVKTFLKGAISDYSLAVDTGLAESERTSAQIQQAKATKESLIPQIATLKKEIEGSKTMINQLDQHRKKENLAYIEANSEFINAISALKGALIVLSKQGASKASLLEAMKLIEKKTTRHQGKLIKALSESLGQPVGPKLSLSFLMQNVTAEGNATESTVQFFDSGTSVVYGILREMLDQFQADLDETSVGEKDAVKTYESLRKAKSDSLDLAERDLETKQERLTTAKQDQVEAEKELVVIEDTLAANQNLLRELITREMDTDAQFTERTTLRGDELKVLQTAIDQLEADLAAIGVGSAPVALLQVSARRNDGANADSNHKKVITALTQGKLKSKAGLRLKERVEQNPLAAVSGQLRGAVEMLMSDLARKMNDESATRDKCTKDLHDNNMATMSAQNTAEQLQAQKEKSLSDIRSITAQIAQHQTDIAKANATLYQQVAERDVAKQQFEKEYGEQQQTIEAIGNGIHILKRAYSSGALLQLSNRKMKQDPTKPEVLPSDAPSFGKEEYKRDSRGGAIISMLEHLQEQSDALAKKLSVAEDEAVAAFQQVAGSLMEEMFNHDRVITTLEGQKARAETQVANYDKSLSGKVDQIGGLNQTKDALDDECQQLLQDFEVRQKAYQDELDALHEALHYITGQVDAGWDADVETLPAEQAAVLLQGAGFLAPAKAQK